MAVDSSGDVLVSDPVQVWNVTPAGAISTLIGGLLAPRGLAVNAAGGLLIAESGRNVIRRLTPWGTLTTIAGTGGAGFSGDGDLATSAQLNAPSDLAIGPDGAVRIADSGNNRIRTLTAATAAADTGAAALVNAASMASGPIAPGEIVTIFESGFDARQTQLLFSGKPATIFYINATQIKALAPADLGSDFQYRAQH